MKMVSYRSFLFCHAVFGQGFNLVPTIGTGLISVATVIMDVAPYDEAFLTIVTIFSRYLFTQKASP